ncbi:MAG: hypothetical protein PHX62_03355 [Bacilli bacterium]|nr:hypothetical protein [Bacilli bacterium]
MKDIKDYPSSDQLVEHWHSIYKVTTVGRDNDFPYYAAKILWERLVPRHKLSIENINDLIEAGYNYCDESDPIIASDVFLDAWEAIKYSLKNKHRTIDDLNELCPGNFYLREDFFNEVN